MSAKHTPGPWKAKFTSGAGLSVHADVSKALGPRYSHDCPIYHTASDAVGLSIAYELWTQFPRAEWEAMQQANARLIAAAPDYHDAAHWICEAVTNNAAPISPMAALEEMALAGQHITLDAGLVLDLLKAHAKATGEQQ